MIRKQVSITLPPNFISSYFVEVARTKIAQGKQDEGRTILDELLANLPSDAAWSFLIIDIAMVYGELHLALGQPENLFSAWMNRFNRIVRLVSVACWPMSTGCEDVPPWR
jgi:hypothetical protein